MSQLETLKLLEVLVFTFFHSVEFSKNIISTISGRLLFGLGADFKNNHTTKQLNNFIWTNRKQLQFCFYLSIGLNKII